MNDPVLDKTQVEDRILFIALELYKHQVRVSYNECLEIAEEIADLELNYQFQPTQEN